MATNSNEANKSKTYEASQMHTALTLSIGAKMGEVLDNRKEDEIAQRKKLAAYLKSDPLGLKSMTMKEESGKRESMREQRELRQSENKVRINTKRGKQEKDNIFTDFGKAHGNGMHTVQIGGVFQQRADFRRHWRSDPDLRRWQQALTDNSKNNKLMFDVRDRWHPNYVYDIADLTQKHNAYYRRPYSSQDSGRQKSSADQLKELQQTLAPGPGKKKKDGTFDEYQKTLLFDPEKVPKNAVGQLMHFIRFLLFHFPRLEDAYLMIDNNGNGSVSYSEFAEALKKLRFPGDIKFIWRLLDTDKSGMIIEHEWKNLDPYLAQMRVQDKLEAMPKGGAQAQADSRRKGSVIGPSSSERSKDSQDSGDVMFGSSCVHWAPEVDAKPKTAPEQEACRFSMRFTKSHHNRDFKLRT
mmetsp:Transcript_1034/g.1860  ORF Transcript_1034/g.1860 Transcript_1034/m.1860 type:complete len:410 (-) Transcript_1034:53-1282(-)